MNSPITQLEQLTLNSKSKAFLKEIAKWSFFLSIIGFVMIAFLVLIGIFAGALYGTVIDTLPNQEEMPFDMTIFMTFFYILMAAIYVFPVLYLYKFSKKMKTALSTKNDDTLSDAFEMLKSHYKFIGVFTIIMILII